MENKRKLLEYLRSFELMVLSTTDAKQSFSCPVFYGVGDDYNFYIVTPPDTIHAKNFKRYPHVSCVVTDTHQKVNSDIPKIGAQVIGEINEITKKENVKEALLIWSKGNKVKADSFLEGIVNKSIKSRVFQFSPAEIKWFNEELYGKEGTEVFTFNHDNTGK